MYACRKLKKKSSVPVFILTALLVIIFFVPSAEAAGFEPLKFTLEESVSGEGYTWDAKTATMTMDNFSLVQDTPGTAPGHIIEFDTGDTPATIVLHGRNLLAYETIHNGAARTGSIKAKNLRITGDGVLTMPYACLVLTDPGASVTIDGGAQVYADMLRAENINISGDKTFVYVSGSGGVDAVNRLTMDGGNLCSYREGAKGGVRAYGIPRDGSEPVIQPMALKNVNIRHGLSVNTAQYTCNLDSLPDQKGGTFFGSMLSRGKVYVQNNILMNNDSQKYAEDKLEIVSLTSVIPNDISGHWAYEDILMMSVPGILGGYSDRTFRPEKKVTRAEFAKMLFAAGDKLGVNVFEKEGDEFPDLGNNWAKKMINGLAEAGVIEKSDYPDGFKPDGEVTRAEAVKMIMRKFGYRRTEEETVKSFPDVKDPDTAYYAGKAVETGVANGNTDGTFAPHKVLTRAEAAAFICNSIYWRT